MLKAKTTETIEATCHNLDDLQVALREANDLDEDGEVKLFIELTFPGIGRQRIELLEEVPIKLEYVVED